jgi:biopolymer transport protein TolQ
MMAFISMAVQGRAEISGMAPGISGALLTTVVGLLVAIPSLIGYNFLSNYIRQLTVYMDNFVEEFMAKIKLEQHDEQ